MKDYEIVDAWIEDNIQHLVEEFSERNEAFDDILMEVRANALANGAKCNKLDKEYRQAVKDNNLEEEFQEFVEDYTQDDEKWNEILFNYYDGYYNDEP